MKMGRKHVSVSQKHPPKSILPIKYTKQMRGMTTCLMGVRHLLFMPHQLKYNGLINRVILGQEIGSMQAQQA